MSLLFVFAFVLFGRLGFDAFFLAALLFFFALDLGELLFALLGLVSEILFLLLALQGLEIMLQLVQTQDGGKQAKVFGIVARVLGIDQVGREHHTVGKNLHCA